MRPVRALLPEQMTRDANWCAPWEAVALSRRTPEALAMEEGARRGPRAERAAVLQPVCRHAQAATACQPRSSASTPSRNVVDDDSSIADQGDIRQSRRREVKVLPSGRRRASTLLAALGRSLQAVTIATFDSDRNRYLVLRTTHNEQQMLGCESKKPGARRATMAPAGG
jgi:hypothetical protein